MTRSLITSLITTFLFLILAEQNVSAWITPHTPSLRFVTCLEEAINKEDVRVSPSSIDKLEDPSSRRRLLSSSFSALLTYSLLPTHLFPVSASDATEKILVLGGTGFVGSRIVSRLQALHIPVIATSRDGRDGTIAFDVLGTSSDDGLAKQVSLLAQGCTAVVSCIGAIGFNDETVGQVNEATALVAKSIRSNVPSVKQFVYISVAPEVAEWASTLDPLKSYVAAKRSSQQAVMENFGDFRDGSTRSATLIQPTFIYGGDGFQLNPPRVASFYGSFIEGLLSSSVFRAAADFVPAGFLQIALEPPVNVDDVAAVAVAGARGLLNKNKANANLNVLDTHDKIVEAARQFEKGEL